MTGALLNRERAGEVMRRAGLDALVLCQPLNVYYASNKLPVLDRMTSTHQSLVVLPCDPARPVTYVGPAFEYYYNVADSSGLAPAVDVHLFGKGPMRVLDLAPLDARELRRRTRTDAAQVHAGLIPALHAVLDDLRLTTAALGIDSLDGEHAIAQAAPATSRRPADDLLRHIRLQKTPAELALMRSAAQANADAVEAAVASARESPTLRKVRQRFFSEAALRGNSGIFMLVDGVMDESYDEPLEEGRAFLVDGVSHCAFYQGDYARTACLGEPSAEMRRIVTALSVAWEEIRASLRPGITFSQIHRTGLDTLTRLGYDYSVAFKPHAVGLAHEDHPRMTLEGKPLDVELIEDMVLSVDCPLIDVGTGGTAHLEDLTLITAGGSEPLHRSAGALLIV